MAGRNCVTRLVGRWRLFALALVFTLPLAGSAHAQPPAGETLYNGIVLPAVWPPHPVLFPVYNPTPPYLLAPPSVIPIDVGRQLFVDDFLIESTTMTRTFHQPVYHPSNPLVFPNRPWEGDLTLAFSDGVFYDASDRLFKMWYMAGLHDHTALAVSTNGITWDKPAYDVLAGTNVVMPHTGRDSNTVWLDHFETNPSKRFKTAWWLRGMQLQSSADGIHWGPTEFSTGRTGDRSTFFYNPFRQKWVFSLRLGDGTSQELLDTRRYGRTRRYAEGSTLLQAAQSWPTDLGDNTLVNLPKWLSADIEDLPTQHPHFNVQLYNVDAAAYESLVVGFFTILTADGTPERPKINQVSLGFSRDGFNFSRPDRRPFFPVSEDPSAWNYGNVQSTAGGGIVVGDEIYFYLTGRRNDQASTGLAVLRRDGFASMDAGSSATTLVTRPVRFTGRHLFVNADLSGGELCAEVLDQNNQVIAPFTSANCVPVTSGGTARQISWAGAPDLSTLSGQPVKFRFTMHGGELYAFWVSPESSGASRGYLTAGSPGLPGGVDTVGRTTGAPNVPPSVTLTAPTFGGLFAAGTAVALGATASDPGGSVVRVDFYVDAQLVASDATSPYEVAWTASTPGPHSVTAVAVDDLNATTSAAAVPVSGVAIPSGSRVNVALALYGTTASASSTANVNYPPSAAIDGHRSGAGRGQLATWEDATAYSPDWIQLAFLAPATIDLVNVFSVQVNSASPVEPTPTLTSYIAAEDFSVQYWNGAAWVDVPGSHVVGNTLVWRQVAFPPITTTAIRIVVTKVYGGNTRLTEVEAYTPASGTSQPAATLTVSPATITQGGSSTLSWTTSGATSVSIDQGIGAVAATGSQLVAPTATTTYTLTATSADGATTRAAVVTVNTAPPTNLPPTVSLTAPTTGSVVNVADVVAVSATASDPGGSVARVEFYVDAQLVASDATSPYQATWTAGTPGVHSVTAVAVDNLNAVTTSAAAAVIVAAVPTGNRVNVALATSGATATASSMANVNYGPSAAIDGRRSGAGRGQLGSWEDATAETPDWLQVTFAAPVTIDLVNVFSLQVNASAPVEPTPTLTSYIAAEDFSVQYWNGAAWVGVPGSAVVGNTLVWRQVAFSPITTTAIRIVVTKVYGNNTRLTEVEAWTVAGASPSATLTVSPATITAGGSSTLSWTTSGATSVSIDQGIGAVASTGSRLVGPAATTTYTLTATNAADATTSTAVVTVQAAPPANVPPVVTLTAPSGGSTFPVATAVALRATASDFLGGSVTRVDFYVDAQLVGSDATSPYEVSWTAGPVGAHSVTAVAVDNQLAATTSTAVAVTVAAVPTGTRVNVALAASGATASASSMANVNYGPSAAIDGRRSGAGRGQLGSWEDATASTPDWLQVTFAAPATIDLVNVFSLQVNASSPVEPTPTLTSYVAVEDFSVQYWTGAAWEGVPGSQVVGNTLVWRPVAFTPVTTTAIRIVVTKVYGSNTRLTEVEAWTPGGAARPTATLTVSPATITAGGSSTLSWTTSDATSVSIDHGIGAVAATGALLVAPTTTTTYTLTATNAAGATTSAGVVTVNAAPPTNLPPIVSLTAPTSGSVVTVGAPVVVSATASDPGGSVARVDFYVDAQLVASDATSPYAVTWTAGAAGAHSLTAVAVDNLAAATTSAAVPVTVAAAPTGTRVNVALAVSGATASASSTLHANYGPSAAIDGRRSGAIRGQLGSWEDATASVPDWLQITFAAPATIDLVNVFSLQVNASAPVEPTPTLTSYIAVEDFAVQYWNGSAWVLVPGGQVVGNNLAWRPVTFAPVTTTAIRIVVTKVYGNSTRLTEVEAWTPAAPM